MSESTSTCVFIHVDDLIIGGPKVSEVKEQLKSRFEMDDLGEAEFILGMKVTRNKKEGSVFVDQSLYISRILEEFGMSNSRPVGTPLNPGVELLKATEEDSRNDAFNY